MRWQAAVAEDRGGEIKNGMRRQEQGLYTTVAPRWRQAGGSPFSSGEAAGFGFC